MHTRLPGHVRYLAAAAHLRELILTGVYPPGSRLPSEQDLCHLCDCGRDAIRDALGVLRRELLITTTRGYRATVCAPPERVVVQLMAGATITAWMPPLADLAQLGCRAEMPVLTVMDADGVRRYPADQVKLLVPRQCGQHR